MIELTPEQLIAHLGQPERKSGAELEWQCPLCQDTGRDNLKFNVNKGFLQCFANKEHTKMILSNMSKNNRQSYQNYSKLTKPAVETQSKFEHIFSEEKQEEFLLYMLKCNNELLAHRKSLDFLFKKRGITKETAEATGLGIDIAKRRWVIPTFEYCTGVNGKILSFEYRPSDLSKKGLYREKNTPTGLAMINCYTSQTDVLAIVEGYFDGYALLQYLKEKEQSAYYHIVTPPSGISSLFKYMPQIDFNKYSRYWLYIDNDDVSNAHAEKILGKYPMFERVVMTCGCKDFNEHYLKCIKKLK